MTSSKAGSLFLAPHFAIWGSQWMLYALLHYAHTLDPYGWLRAALPWAALIASAICLALAGTRRRRHPASPPKAVKTPALRRFTTFVVAVAILAAFVLLARADIVPLFAGELLRSLALVLMYFYMGFRLGRRFGYLGLWLLALVLVISIWYLGYAPIVLGFSAGSSLLACSVMLRKYARAVCPQGTAAN